MVRYPPGGSRYPPPGGVPGQVPPPPWGGPGTPPRGGPGTPPGGLGYPPGGYPVRYPPWGGLGTPLGGYPVRYPPPRGGYPVRTTEGVLTTWRAVCLLHSRRRTFLFVFCERFTLNKNVFQSQVYHLHST